VLLVHEWQHTSYGRATGESTKDYRCQICGAKYCVRPRLQTIAGLVIGVMAATTIIGLPFFFFYWRRHRVGARIPVVPMVAVPPLRYGSGPEQRKCDACPSAATVVKVTRSTINGIPDGTEYVYRCNGCNTEFTIQSIWGIAVGFLLTLVMAGVTSLFLVFAETPGWRWGGSGVSAAIVLLILGQAIAYIRTRQRHPVARSVDQLSPTTE
jgi:DNA-directed RNA polymerase subunit RPC12/RpoP